MIIKVYVIDDFAESFIANTASKVNDEHSIIGATCSGPFVFKELSEVCRLMCNYTLMCRHLKTWDQHLLFFSPVTFSYLEILLRWLLLGLRVVASSGWLLYNYWRRLAWLLLLLSNRPSLIRLLLLKLRLTLTRLLLRLYLHHLLRMFYFILIAHLLIRRMSSDGRIIVTL